MRFGFDKGEVGDLWDAVLSPWSRFPVGRERLCLPQGMAGRSCAHQDMVPPLQSLESLVSTARSKHETLESTAGAGAGAGLSLQL